MDCAKHAGLPILLHLKLWWLATVMLRLLQLHMCLQAKEVTGSGNGQVSFLNMDLGDSDSDDSSFG